MNEILEDITVRYYAILRTKNETDDKTPFVFLYEDKYYLVLNIFGHWHKPIKIDFFDLSKPLEK